jgi:hypothetical protein
MDSDQAVPRRAVGLMLALVVLAVFGPQVVAQTSAPSRLKEAGDPPTAAAVSGLSKPDLATRGKILQGYGWLPLSFEANEGQTDNRVRFLSRGGGHTVFLTPTDAVLAMREGISAAPKETKAAVPPAMPSKLAADERASRTTALRMRLVGANPSAKIVGAEELPGKSNYFIGNDPKKWRTNVPTYAKVKYPGVYPGVDLVYYGNQGQLEYDFVLAPGADPRAISLSFSGVRRIRLDRQTGDLILKTGTVEVRFHKPNIYQPSSSHDDQRAWSKTTVEGHYRLTHHQVTFELPSYDKTRPLVIDPALSYSTYLGGSGFDQANAIAVDTSGNLYLAGLTESADFPTTSGAFQPGLPGANSAFVTKMDAAGAVLLYSTYLGGNSSDYGQGIAVDSTGEAYVVGLAQSSDFPVTANAFQKTFAGVDDEDAFMTKLNSTGSALLYSTYLGGSVYQFANAVALDSAGNAYLTGSTGSANFPTTPGAFDTICGTDGACNGTDDAFVSKIDPSLSGGPSLVYSTYLGGSSSEGAYGIAVDSSGDAFVGGLTSSPDFPTTPGSFATTYGGGQESFVTKLNSTGSGLVYSTYFGGNSEGYPNGIAIDAIGDAYIAGQTSATIPTTSGAFQTAFGPGSADAFVAELNASGTGLVYSTYLHGSVGEGASSIVVNGADAVVTGYTSSPDFPTLYPLQPPSCPTHGVYSCPDAFVTELNAAGSALVYSTYIGGSGGDLGYGVGVDGSGNAYVAGHTSSTDFPITPGAFQTTFAGNYDAFLLKLVPGPLAALSTTSLSFGDQNLGIASPGESVTLTNPGSQTLGIASVAVTGANSGDFAETNTCGTSLAAGATCTINVTFTPTATGTRTAAITVTDNAPNSPQTISLSGVGTQPAVTVSPNSLTFPTQVVFTGSKAQTVTLTNSGTGTLNVTSVAVAGQFSQTNTCGASVVPGTSCTISITFRPTKKGTLTAPVSITDNALGSPQAITLTGVGTYVALSPAALNFGSQPVGTKSLPKTIALSNKGSVAMSITAISITGADPGDFAQADTCGSSVAAGASCFIKVTFTPSAKGKRTAGVSVSDYGGGSPQKVSLTGLGT